MGKRKPPHSPLAELGMGAAWLLGLSAVCQIVAVLFQSNLLAIAVVQAVIVEIASLRANVKWDPNEDPKRPSNTAPTIKAIGVGAGVALAVTMLTVGLSLALGWVKISAHQPTTSLFLGLIRSVAFAVRDVLLYTALPFTYVTRAFQGAPPSTKLRARLGALVFGALAPGAVLALSPAASPSNIALAVSVGAASAALWIRTESGFASAGLVGGYWFFAGVLIRGGWLDVDWKKGWFAPGPVANGAPAWVAAAALLAVAVWSVRSVVARETST